MEGPTKRSWKHSNLPTHQQCPHREKDGVVPGQSLSPSRCKNQPWPEYRGSSLVLREVGLPNSNFMVIESLTGNAFSFSGSFVGNMYAFFCWDLRILRWSWKAYCNELERMSAQTSQETIYGAEWRFWNYTWKFNLIMYYSFYFCTFTSIKSRSQMGHQMVTPEFPSWSR